MSRDLEFDQGVLKLSSFDPLSNRVQTRVLRLPDVPALESLEQLFSTNTPSSSCAHTQPNTRDGTHPPEVSILRSTRSLNSKRPASPTRAPRRCYSNPALSKKKDALTGSVEPWKAPRRSPSKRSLLNALSGLLQKAKRPTSIRRPRRCPSIISNSGSSIHGTWHAQTWLIEMRASSDSLEPPKKVPRCHPGENWWASSPPALATARVL